MSKSSALLGEALRAELKAIIQEALQEAFRGQNGHQGDRLLDVEETAKLLCVEEDWLYRHHKKLPFAKKLCPKMLRFSYQGIQRYLTNKKTF